MKPLSVVVRTGCDLFAWFMVIFGAYVIIHGDVTPGGGFQGGAVVATFLAFLLVAYGWNTLKLWLQESVYNAMLGFGLLCFLVLGFMGMPASFFYNFVAIPAAEVAKSGHGIIPPSGTIALMDIAVGIEVTGGLSLILVYMFKGIHLFDNYEIGEESGHDR
ncbi:MULTISPECIES: MnhB domain-containing protein [Aminobacterium]|mgnify:FL=1|jgi:energy-converting hydrogenase B subunit I|uniref:MnhB domain-containing protein n=1 Tax=Aminobacterium TaxID=81466 RepID=UPI000467AD43|nr:MULTISPECIES: MnhB domain-containing protein [Aminobacterium]